MKHTIRVNDDTYHELQRLQRPRETYNEVITRLIRVFNTIFNVSKLLGPSHWLHSDKPPGSDPITEARRDAVDLEARKL